MSNADLEKSGFVYIMTNPSMPGLIKVGMTTRNPALRAKDDDLTSTGVPTPFIVEYSAYFDDMMEAERSAHQALSDYHYGKEFFKTDVPTAIHAVENTGLPFKKIYSKPEDEERAAEIAKKKVHEEWLISLKEARAAEKEAEEKKRAAEIAEKNAQEEKRIAEEEAAERQKRI